VILINRHDTALLGGKIREIRIARGITQDELASAASSDSPSISKIENGNLTCSDDLLWEIKKVLRAEEIPLLANERESFMDKLQNWYDVISERKLVKANEMRIGLSAITCLPSEKELNTIYALFECRLFLGLNEIEPAQKILMNIEPNVDLLTDTQKYHYYYNKGTLEIKNARSEEALNFYLMAFNLMKRGLKESHPLYYSIAYCYFRTGSYLRSIAFLEKFREQFSSEQNGLSLFHAENLLATNYIRTNNFQLAKILLDKCHAFAIENKDDVNIGMVLLNYGYLYFMAKNYNKAFEYLNEAKPYLDESGSLYLEALYQKARCMIAMNRFTSCAPLLEDGIIRAKGNETYQILFVSLSRFLTINQIESRAYLEDVAIPFLIKTHNYIIALDYSESLANYYSKKGKGYNGKRLKMVDIAHMLYKKMYEGGVL